MSDTQGDHRLHDEPSARAACYSGCTVITHPLTCRITAETHRASSAGAPGSKGPLSRHLLATSCGSWSGWRPWWRTCLRGAAPRWQRTAPGPAAAAAAGGRRRTGQRPAARRRCGASFPGATGWRCTWPTRTSSARQLPSSRCVGVGGPKVCIVHLALRQHNIAHDFRFGLAKHTSRPLAGRQAAQGPPGEGPLVLRLRLLDWRLEARPAHRGHAAWGSPGAPAASPAKNGCRAGHTERGTVLPWHVCSTSCPLFAILLALQTAPAMPPVPHRTAVRQGAATSAAAICASM